MNIWHNISASRITPEEFIACIEISAGSKNKYELDKESGVLILDRILYTSTHYPQNYGFIPRTYADDNDPLDVLIICSQPIMPMSLVKCYPIGLINMIDEGQNDEKIIAISMNDPVYNSYKDINELPEHIFEEIRHFFKVYKKLEGKTTKVYSAEGKARAVEVIKECIDRYERIFGHLTK